MAENGDKYRKRHFDDFSLLLSSPNNPWEKSVCECDKRVRDVPNRQA